MLDASPFGLTSFTPLGTSLVVIAGPGGLNDTPIMDLNGDGLGDMIVEYGNGVGTGSPSIAAVSALLMNADGSTREYQIARYTVPAAAPLPVIDQVLVADFNGDGQPDVAVLHNDGSGISTHKWIDIFMGQPDGTFTEPAAPIDLGTAIATPTMTLFDENGDGKTDIFLQSGTAFTAYLGNGDGTFAAPVTTDLFSTALKLQSVTNASFEQDLSGDGIPDLVVSGQKPSFVQAGSQYSLYVFKGQANGKYNLTPSFSDTTDDLTLLAMRQLSSDNNPDIVAYSSGTVSSYTVASSIFVFRNAGNGTFTQTFHSATFPSGLPTVALGINPPKQPLLTPDLTGDGIDDMILVEGGLGTNNNVILHILKNNGNAGFTETQQIPFTSVGSYDSSGLVEDVDGDGLPDLVVYRFTADNGAEQTSIYFNHGGGVFDSTGLVPQTSASVTAGSFPGLADFNGDGKLDLVYTGFSQADQKNILEVLLNTTGRAFGPGVDSDETYAVNLSRDQTTPPDALLDYTGDHLPDLVGYFGADWSILASTGDGHFTTLEPPLTFGGMEMPEDPLAADINNDGKIDLIFGQPLGPTDESAGGLMVVMNGATPPADTAGGDASTARDLGTLTGPISLTEFVNAAVNTPQLSSSLDAADFYKFTLASAQSVHITATPASGGQVSLVLQDSNGAGLVFSGDTPAEVNASLQPGTYYVGVQRAGGGDTRYRLDIELAPVTPAIGVLEGFATVISGQDSTISFGNVKVSTTDTHQVFTIRNDGSLPLNLGTIAFPAGFVLDGTAPISILQPGDSATLSVSMVTTTAGQFSGNIDIPSDDPVTSDFLIPVAGTVTGSVMTDLSGQFASSPALPTGLIAGQSAPLSFTLSNAGPSAADGTYSIQFQLEKGAPQLGKGDVAAGSASGAITLNPGTTTIPLTASFTAPPSLAAGTYYLAATITDAGGDIDTNTADKTFFSGPITIGLPATHLAFVDQPPKTVTAGSAIGPTLTLQVLDASNHMVSGDNSSVTVSLALNSGGATLSGTTTVQVVNGVASFTDLSLSRVGTYSLTASDGNLAIAKSSTFTVVADASSPRLVLTSQPGAAVVGTPMSPIVVVLEDSFGNPITAGTSASSSVTLAIAAGSAEGNFSGKNTLSAKPSKGVATFSKATLSAAGTYTLSLSDAGAQATPISFAQTISPGVTTVAPPHTLASYTFGQTISLSTTLKSTAGTSIPFTGTASIIDQSSDVLANAVVTANGSTKFELSGAAAGSYTVTLAYPGDANHSAATSSTFTLLVNQASTTMSLATSASTLVFGQPLTLTATVKPVKTTVVPTGSVSFYDGLTLLGTVGLNGHGTASLPVDPIAGKHAYKVVYSGDVDFKTSTSSSTSRTVNPTKTTITLTTSQPGPIPLNQTFSFSVHVSVIAPSAATVGGAQVIITENGEAFASINLDDNGDATTVPLQFNTPGTHDFAATFVGGANLLTATSPTLKLTIS